MNYTFVYEFFSLTVFALYAVFIMANSFVEKRQSKLRCFFFLLIPKLIQQYCQYYNTNVEQTVLTTVLFSASTLIFDFFLFFVVFEGSFQEIVVAVAACDISALPVMLYKRFVLQRFTPEGASRIFIGDFATLILTCAGCVAVTALVVIINHFLGKLLVKINYNSKFFSALGIIGMLGFIVCELFAIIDDGIVFFLSKEYLFRYAFVNLAWIVFFVVMYIINDYFTKKRLRREIEVLNEEKTRQFEYYNLMKIHNEEIRKIRHDMKGHISVISTFVEEKEYDRVEEYVSTLSENLQKIKRVNVTGNVTADTVICDVKEKCESKNIKFVPKGILPEKTGIDDVSLTCILTNVLNNACEACLRMKESEERFINLDVYVAGGCVVIKCENSKSENEKINPRNIKTIKKENGHGYGMKIINDIVKEKDGTIEIEDNENSFVIDILLTAAKCSTN